MSKQISRPIEIEQEIEYLLSQYKEHMQVHKMAVFHGALRTAVVGAATIAENLVKIKWGKLAESLFALTNKQELLMKEELKAPGRELSYLLLAGREFGKEQSVV